MPPINKDHAKNIAKKVNDKSKSLGATIDKSAKAHDLVCIYYKGVRIASFGMRRGSDRNQPHGHIPKELHLSPRQTILFAQCTFTVDQWLDVLREAREIEDDADDAAEEQKN